MATKRTFAYGAATHQGRWPVQEDGYFVDPSSGIFVLADGFGGRGQGDIAAKMTLQECRSAKRDLTAREGGIYSPAQAWQRELFAEINKKLLQWNEKRAAGAKGATSLIMASVDGERELTVTSCGACSALILRGGRWLPVLSAQASPRASAEDALFPQQALGMGRELNPESRSVSWEPGDILLLFSSGCAWESETFQAELGGQLALRMPGSDLGPVAALAAEGGGGWNQTIVAVEALL